MVKLLGQLSLLLEDFLSALKHFLAGTVVAFGVLLVIIVLQTLLQGSKVGRFMGGVCGLGRSIGFRVITIVSYACTAVIVRSRASMTISTVLKAISAANHVHFTLRLLTVIGKSITIEDLVLIFDSLKLSL